MTLIIVLYVALNQTFYFAEPKTQETCHEEGLAVLQGMQKQFPDQEFKAACVSDAILKKKGREA